MKKKYVFKHQKKITNNKNPLQVSDDVNDE